MKWIKASDRLPIFTHRLISRFIHTQTPMFDFKEWALRNSDKLNLVEWLDESSPSDNTQIRGGWVRVQDGLPPLIDDKDYSENVIAFCNGILMVMCYMYINEDGGGYVWANCYGDIKGDAEFDDDYYPTHWMPLPTPPND